MNFFFKRSPQGTFKLHNDLHFKVFVCAMCLHEERRAELLCLTATDHSFYSFSVQLLVVLLKKNRKYIFTKLYKKRWRTKMSVFHRVEGEHALLYNNWPVHSEFLGQPTGCRSDKGKKMVRITLLYWRKTENTLLSVHIAFAACWLFSLH